MNKLRFHAVEGHYVHDMLALAHGIRRVLGHKYCEVSPGVWGFELQEGEIEVDYDPHYISSCKSGALVPADAGTAKLCGVEMKGDD